jgi:RNA polymerase sigma-70 factor (ECF subfamily)
VETTVIAHTAPGDESALWAAYGQPIYRYLLRLTGKRETAEDLLQETFLHALRDLRRGGPAPANQRAWLYRIATNRAIDLLRRRRRFTWLPFQPDRHGGTEGDTADSLAQQDLVLRALRTLPRETAALLLLKDGEGLTSQEIAAMTGDNYEAVRKRIARARETFRGEYQRLKGECE